MNDDRTIGDTGRQPSVEERALRREELTAITFVEIVDTLVDDFDVIEVLTVLTARTVELLAASAAGILLADEHGHLRVMAASSEKIQLLELFQLQNDEGPCLDSYRTGTVVAHPTLGPDSPWPRFAAESVASGYPSVCAIPMRFKERVLGCLNLFISRPVALPPTDVALAQALADVASIAVVQDQATRLAAVREGNLQHALTSRISIEQAKGMVAEYARVDMDQAFARLRQFARNHNRGLTEVAQSLATGELVIESVAGPRRPRTVPPGPAS
ncbi:MAG: GAF and ANTAR domain-containing protein [Actinobacteria bacterium]|nr:GAF and ANTAR domain-containing protein [Actinomycetota bacterium]